MIERNIRNICCIGAGFVGGPTMAVIAYKCPDLIVNVLDINEEEFKIGTMKIFHYCYEDGLSEIIEKCRNKNLFFK